MEKPQQKLNPKILSPEMRTGLSANPKKGKESQMECLEEGKNKNAYIYIGRILKYDGIEVDNCGEFTC